MRGPSQGGRDGGREAEASGDQGRRKKKRVRSGGAECRQRRRWVGLQWEGSGGQRGKVSYNQACAPTISRDVQKGPVHPRLKEAGRLRPSSPWLPAATSRLLPLPQAWGSREQGEGRRTRCDNRGELGVKKIEGVQKRAQRDTTKQRQNLGK